ncbi:MAG: TolC family protein, partial [Acidobacteriota bacterium]|nr:TolC family protein [Acidobacteriota bacterium]
MKRAIRRAGARIVSALLAAALAGSVMAQQTPKKYVLQGTVVSVDAAGKRLSVHNDPVPGWMGEMTMGYAVDNPSVLSRLRPGDRITATVYEGDQTLHEVAAAQSVAATADAGGITLDALEKMALTNNPTVAQAEANVRAAAGLARQAGLYPNPTAGYYGDEIRGGVIGGGKQGAFLSQTIVMGGKLRAAKRAAELESDRVREGTEIQKLRILTNVRILFYQALAAQRLVELREELAKLAADVTLTSRQLGNVGQADRPDILQAEVEEQQARIAVTIARQNLQSAWRVLAAVAGKSGMPAEKLAGDLDSIPELNYADQVAAILRESPEVSAAEKSVEHAEASLTVERKAPIPDLQVSGTLAQNHELLDEITGRQTGLMGGVQVGIELPIFNRNQG